MPILNWIGKKAVFNHDKEVPFKLLKKNKKLSVGNASENLIVQGDNLEALKALMPYYQGKIKCIYIDPPYNTGNEKWVYNDNVNSPKIKKWLGKVVGKESEDLCRHDKWLCMMYPRLKLLRELLSEDGVIFVSIDDHELSNLIQIMDEIFGNNRIDRGMIIWNNAGSTKGFRNIVKNHEYVLAYAKNINKINNYFGLNFPDELGLVEGRLQIKRTKRNPLCRLKFLKGTPIEGVSNKKFEKCVGGSTNRIDIINGPMSFKKSILEKDIILEASFPYRFQVQKYYDNLKKGQKTYDSKGQEIISIFFKKNGIPYYRKRRNILVLNSVQSNLPNSGLKDLNKLNIFNFNNPKPIELILKLLSYFTSKDSLILDSFAGSGTTAHAVMELNKRDKGNRKFITIELESKIAREITSERIKRSINKYNYKENFEFCELDKPLFNEFGDIDDSCSYNQLASYIYFTETQTNIDKSKIKNNFIGEYQDINYYLLFKEKGKNTLDKRFFNKIKNVKNIKIIYADKCLIDQHILEKYNIIFKQIPYEVKVY